MRHLLAVQIAVSFAFVSISFVLLQAAAGDNLDTVRAMWLVTGVVFLVTFNGLGKLLMNRSLWDFAAECRSSRGNLFKNLCSLDWMFSLKIEINSAFIESDNC